MTVELSEQERRLILEALRMRYVDADRYDVVVSREVEVQVGEDLILKIEMAQ